MRTITIAVSLLMTTFGACGQDLSVKTVTFKEGDASTSKTIFQNGSETRVAWDGDGLAVGVGEVQLADKHTFRVEVAAGQDGREESVLDPRQCTLIMSDGEQFVAADGDTWMSHESKHERRRQAWANAFGSVGAGMNANQTVTYTDNAGYQGTTTYRDQAVIDNENRRQAAARADLDQHLAQVGSRVLRKTSLLTNAPIGGNVFFPVKLADKHAYPIAIRVQLGSRVFLFPYEAGK